MNNETPSSGDGVLYRENIYFGTALWFLVLALIALYVVVLVGAVAKRRVGIAVGMGIVTAIIVALLANFFRLTFLITETEIVFGFGVIKKRFARSRVSSCEPYTLKFRNYLGYGIRIGMDNTIAYNTRSGRGVKLSVDGAKRPYVISVNDPDTVCTILNLKDE